MRVAKALIPAACLIREQVLLCCDGAGCKAQFHLACVGLKKLPKGDWFCVACGKTKSREDSAACGTEQDPNPARCENCYENGALAHDGYAIHPSIHQSIRV